MTNARAASDNVAVWCHVTSCLVDDDRNQHCRCGQPKRSTVVDLAVIDININTGSSFGAMVGSVRELPEQEEGIDSCKGGKYQGERQYLSDAWENHLPGRPCRVQE